MPSNINFGRKFVEAAAREEQEMAVYKRRIEHISEVQSLSHDEITQYLLRAKPELDNLYYKASFSTARQLRKAGFRSYDQNEYCQGAWLFLTILKDDAHHKIKELTAKKAARSAKTIGEAESWFYNISPYHGELLDGMRSRPN